MVTGLKWSPRILKSWPFRSTIGGWRFAYARMACSKMPKSQVIVPNRRNRQTDKTE